MRFAAPSTIDFRADRSATLTSEKAAANLTTSLAARRKFHEGDVGDPGAGRIDIDLDD
jgi:hypothetical protein